MIYRFGRYQLDDSGRELRRDGTLVDTEPKAFELLLYLLRHRDRAVTKDELQTALWPRSIVTETALTRCVMKARRAVGDDAGRQSVIRTLHSHGYRFVADLEPEQQPPQPPQEKPGSRPAAAPTRYVLAGIATLLVVLAVGFFAMRGTPRPAEEGALAVLPVDDRTDDDKLAWVRLGLMSLLNRMLEDGGVALVSERSVLSAVGDANPGGPPDSALLARIRLRAGAGAVLNTTLDLRGGLYRLAAVLTHSDGHRTRRVIVGDKPAAIAADMARVISGLLAAAGKEPAGPFSKVSTDPFVNEMYARALDLELQGEYDEARSLFRVAADQEPELFWLRYEIALCTRDLREWDEAEKLFDALYQEARAGDQARALISTLNALGILSFLRNDYDAAEPRFVEALPVAAASRFATERAALHINLALITKRRGDLKQAKVHYDLALRAFQEAGQAPGPNFDNNYAGLLMDLGELSTAQTYAERAVDGFRLRGQRRYEAPSLNRLAKILRRRGDIEGALARHEQARTIYHELGDELGELSVMSAMTAVYRDKGDLTRARLNASEVMQRAENLDDRARLADARLQAAHVAAGFGDYDAALSEYAIARDIYQSLNDDPGLREAAEGIARSALALGDTGRAAGIADSLLESADEVRNAGAKARAQWLGGLVAGARGDGDASIAHHLDALAYARDNGDESLRIDAAAALASLYLERGDTARAAVLVEEIRPLSASRQDFMRLDARLAFAQGSRDRALEIMSELRVLAGEAWRPGDDQLLRTLQE